MGVAKLVLQSDTQTYKYYVSNFRTQLCQSITFKFVIPVIFILLFNIILKLYFWDSVLLLNTLSELFYKLFNLRVVLWIQTFTSFYFLLLLLQGPRGYLTVLYFYVILTPREIFYKTNVIGRQTVKAIIINFVETSPVTLCM